MRENFPTYGCDDFSHSFWNVSRETFRKITGEYPLSGRYKEMYRRVEELLPGVSLDDVVRDLREEEFYASCESVELSYTR